MDKTLENPRFSWLLDGRRVLEGIGTIGPDSKTNTPKRKVAIKRRESFLPTFVLFLVKTVFFIAPPPLGIHQFLAAILFREILYIFYLAPKKHGLHVVITEYPMRLPAYKRL